MTEHDFAAWEREAALDRAVADDHEVADELRVLLQLAPPHLSAPADRMERVLARAALARRRRRRAALAAGLAVGLTAAVLAAAPALAPGPTGTVLSPAASGPALGAMPPAGSPEASASASPGPGSGDQGNPSPSGSPSVGADGGSTEDLTGDPTAPIRPTRFTALDGVVLDVPDAWSDLTLLATAGRPDPVGYIASQPLAREPGCQIRNGVQPPVCLAAGGLLDNSVMVSVRLVRDEKLATETSGRSVMLRDIEVEKDCAVQGGSRQIVAQQVVVPNGQAEVVELSACLRRPSQETISAVYRVASSVRLFGAATNSPITSTG
ncbi:hypothetical protein ACFVGM_21020 [Kitasatospora purpeofusca]|uniref:hypothetical protein n=1 Tax=Kitasatospora purpeofusca TaxID=67352 RepID=UPI003674EB79